MYLAFGPVSKNDNSVADGTTGHVFADVQDSACTGMTCPGCREFRSPYALLEGPIAIKELDLDAQLPGRSPPKPELTPREGTKG